MTIKMQALAKLCGWRKMPDQWGPIKSRNQPAVQVWYDPATDTGRCLCCEESLQKHVWVRHASAMYTKRHGSMAAAFAKGETYVLDS